MNVAHARNVFDKVENEFREYGSVQQASEWLALLFTVRVLSDNAALYPEAFTGNAALLNWQSFLREPRQHLKRTLKLAAPLVLMAQIFEEFEAARVPDTILTRAVFEFDNLASRFTTLEELRIVCGPLIDALVLRRGYGDIQQFYTMSAPAQLAAKIVNKAHIQTVYDPTCGLGVSLTTLRALRERDDIRFTGQDINARAVTLATMRLLMHGIEHFHLKVGNTLTAPYTADATLAQLPEFDAVLSDPPLGGKITQVSTLDADPYSRFKFGKPSRRSLEWSFIQHNLASLNSTGIATVLTSAATLFRLGEEAQTRRNVVSADLLEAVIALPNGVFGATNISGYLLVFNHTKRKTRQDHVLFVDVSANLSKRKNAIAGQWADGDFVEAAYLAYDEEENALDTPVALVPKQTIVENDGDLSPKRYLMSAIEITPPTLEEIAGLQDQARDAWESLESSRVRTANAWRAVLNEE
jgi:N-6 DNA Methylase